ncbi:MAG: YveK family protein [Streptosporangiaceae bacterium]
MSEQALDLKRSLRIVRRHWIIVGVFALLGVLAGAGYGTVKPPMLSSQALVALPANTHDVSTQVVVADSTPVLLQALPHVQPGMSLQVLRNRVSVTSLTTNIVSITAMGRTAADAQITANAVASSYITYANSTKSAAGKVHAQVLQQATGATGTSPLLFLVLAGFLGLLAGTLVGSIAVLAMFRGDRRLRERDQIADSIGLPVLAALPVWHPSSAAAWVKLLGDYQPDAVHAWRLRTALHYLGLAGVSTPDTRGGQSLTVLSLASDRRALALGPQLAVFAASLGIPTTLVIGPQQDASSTATLRTAYAGPPQSAGRLRVIVVDHDNAPWHADTRLVIVVTVVDGRHPQVAETIRTNATVLGVSTGAVTATQLASVATSAATDGRQIDGILVADPDPADHTTGRVPQLARPPQLGPTRLPGNMAARNGSSHAGNSRATGRPTDV